MTLAVTPLRQRIGWSILIRFRRMLGLLTFFYTVLHVSAYLGPAPSGEASRIVGDILTRPSIIVGFAAFILLCPLALTATHAAVRWLGGKRWQTLHRSLYLVAILACIHTLWLVNRDALAMPLIETALIAVLLGLRMRQRIRAHGPWPQPPRSGVQTIRVFPRRPPA